MPILISEYNTNWPKLFSEEALRLEKILSKSSSVNKVTAIEHIGSTAIPNIIAKPVIDIMIGVPDLLQFGQNEINLITSLGYVYIKTYEKHIPNRRIFQKDGSNDHRAYQIHLVNYNSAWWGRHILFRDYLRHHPKQANEYAQVKHQLATLLNQGTECADSKKQFFEEFINPYPTLNKQYKELLNLFNGDLPLTNLYAIAKSPFIQKITKKAYFNFEHHQPNVSSPRLNGYIPQIACLDLYKQMFQDPDFVHCYGVNLSDEKLLAILERDTNYWDKYGFGPYVWFDKKSNTFVGEGGLNHTIVDGNHEIELTYSLTKKYWGRGIAVEIGQFAINHAFNNLQLDNIACFTMTTNHQSLRVIKKLGFEYEKDFTHFNFPHKLFRLNR